MGILCNAFFESLRHSKGALILIYTFLVVSDVAYDAASNTMEGSINKPLKMYNLNVNVATALGPGGLLGIDGQCTTPRTPEILNSLIAMSNPFDALGKTGQENTSPRSDDSRSGAGSPLGITLNYSLL